jgi:hypothetical protein
LNSLCASDFTDASLNFTRIAHSKEHYSVWGNSHGNVNHEKTTSFIERPARKQLGYRTGRRARDFFNPHHPASWCAQTGV